METRGIKNYDQSEMVPYIELPDKCRGITVIS